MNRPLPLPLEREEEARVIAEMSSPLQRTSRAK